MYCTVLYCNVLCLALLPFASSFFIGKYPCNSLIMLFNILFKFAFLFCMLFYLLSSLCFGIVLCIVSAFVNSCLFPTFVQIYRRLSDGGKSMDIISYHKQASCVEFIDHISLKSLRQIASCVLVCSKFNKFRTPRAMQFKQKDRLTTRSLSIS
jgi:hypothetical protein